MEAAKRVGLAYVAVAAGTVAAVLADRLRDTLGAVLMTRAELLEAVQAALELLEPSARPTVVLAPSSGKSVLSPAVSSARLMDHGVRQGSRSRLRPVRI